MFPVLFIFYLIFWKRKTSAKLRTFSNDKYCFLLEQNILLTSRESDGVLKIADFGLSSFPILETELYIQVNMLRRFVVPPYIWLQKFSNFKATMKRLICGVLVQFFLILMDTHHFVVELMFSFCRTLCHADVFPFLTLSFQI